LQSVTGQQGVAYHPSYNIAGLISEVSEEVATQIAKNCRRRQPHSHLRPRLEEPQRVSAYTLYFQKLESSAYVFVAACMGLSSFNFLHWPQKTRTHQSAFWPCKVVQGHPRPMILVPIESAYATSY